MSTQLAAKRVVKKNIPSLKPVLATRSPSNKRNSSIIVTPAAKRSRKSSAKVTKSAELASNVNSRKSTVTVSQYTRLMLNVSVSTCALIIGNLEFITQMRYGVTSINCNLFYLIYFFKNITLFCCVIGTVIIFAH